MNVEVIGEAKKNVHRSAGEIVDAAFVDTITETDFGLPKPGNMARTANRARQKLRPSEPNDLNFEIDMEFLDLESFLVGDVKVEGDRHLIFATERQLDILKNARRWFMDGTYKIRRDPFKQLYSIHAFLQKDESVKQVPLCFILMSRKRKIDYVAVLEKLVEQMGGVVQVGGFVMDFEAGWHRCLNGNAGKANLQVYVLVPLLRREANMVPIQHQWVRKEQLSRYQRLRYRKMRGEISNLWTKYEDKKLATSDFLKAVGNLYAPPAE